MEVATRRREQEVWQACDDLWALLGDASGITGDAIRERLVFLGKSRGSPNEIYKYRKTWVKSRGVSFTQETQEESDPISRAVRMVHENLQVESSHKIEELKEVHEQALLQKDEDLNLSKKALDSLMQEYRAVQKSLEESLLKLEEKSAQCLAEIEARLALERELALKKALSDQQARAHEDLLAELKKGAQLELSKAEKRNAEISNEVKRMGQEYSDLLTAQKIAFYNQELLTKERAKKVAELELELSACHEKIIDKDIKIEWLIKENNQMADKLLEKSTQLLVQKTSLDFLAVDRKNLNIFLKRSEIEVAKLRVMAKMGGLRAP